jgi:hypothetical protein
MAIPIAAYGRHAPVAEGVRQKLLPEYDVVHTCLDLESAENELPAVFGGALETSAASGLGTNAERDPSARLAPKILFFGAGIPAEEIEQVSGAVSAKAPGTYFVHISPDDIKAAGGQGPPDLDIISKVLKEKFGKLE